MGTINNGGPAFPMSRVTVLAEDGTPNEAAGIAHDGMSLRDWFAGRAMQGLLSNPKLAAEILKHGGAESGWIEESAYGFADGMLVERHSAFRAPQAKTEARVTAIVRAFLDEHHVSCPETIHQTDYVIENAYGLIEELADVVGYYQYPEDEA